MANAATEMKRGADTGSTAYAYLRAGLSGSTAAERAREVFLDPDRARQLIVHRRWLLICNFLGFMLLVGSIIALKVQVVETVQAERFIALLSILGCVLLIVGVFSAWHSSAVERHLYRLALMRLDLDSMEATAESLRMRSRLHTAAHACERLPEPRRGKLAIAVLSVLAAVEENAEGKLTPTDDVTKRLVAAGMTVQSVEAFASGEDIDDEEEVRQRLA